VPRAQPRTVERGKNPEDGTGGGLATSTLRTAALGRTRRGESSSTQARSALRRQGHPASWRSREQETQERRFPYLDGRPRPRKRTEANPGCGQPRRGSALKGKRTPGEDLPGFGHGSQVGRETPRGRLERRGGSAQSHERATRQTAETSEGDANSTRARSSAGDCVRPPRRGRESLEGETTRTATRRHPHR